MCVTDEKNNAQVNKKNLTRESRGLLIAAVAASSIWLNQKVLLTLVEGSED